MSSNETDVGRENRARWLVALAGLLAGLLAFGVGELVYGLIPTENEEVNTMGHILMVPTVRTTNRADTRNAALTFGLLGVCLGGLMGIAGGLSRRSAAAMGTAGLLGAILGLACGAGVSLAVLPLFFHTQPIYPDYDVMISMIMHGSIWGITGAAAGLAFGIGLGERRGYGRAPTAGFVGALLGAIVFDLAGGILLPFGTTGQPISTTWPTRLMARLLVTLATAAFIILLLPGPCKPSGESAIAPPSE